MACRLIYSDKRIPLADTQQNHKMLNLLSFVKLIALLFCITAFSVLPCTAVFLFAVHKLINGLCYRFAVVRVAFIVILLIEVLYCGFGFCVVGTFHRVSPFGYRKTAHLRGRLVYYINSHPDFTRGGINLHGHLAGVPLPAFLLTQRVSSSTFSTSNVLISYVNYNISILRCKEFCSFSSFYTNFFAVFDKKSSLNFVVSHHHLVLQV